MEVSSSTASSSPPPFLTKTYEMVDDHITDSIVSWAPTGHSFVVWNPPEFARDLLPKYFKHNNFSSFVRQLNTYGFRKIDPDQWEFANDEFIRGKKHLLKNIHRRKPIHSHSTQNQVASASLTESEKQEYEAEIERLKHDKSVLLSELQKYKQENQLFEFQTQSLGKRLFNMEHRQRKMMAHLAQVLQKPELGFSPMTQSEIHNKKRRLLMPNYISNEANIEQNMVMPFQKEKQDVISVPVENFEMIENLESSLNFLEKFLSRIGQGSADTVDGFGTLFQPSPIIITEMHSSSEPDTNTQPCSPKSYLSSPHSQDVHSSAELARATDHTESPAISSIYLNMDSCPKSLRIDVNSEPTNASGAEASKELEGGITNAAASAGANDVFWAQFLTETPGSSNAQEVQSERRDMYISKSDSRPDEQRKYWWNTNNVDNLTEKMGHLTSAEKT